MAKKKTEKTVKHEARKTIVPEGVEPARVRDMANDFNIHHIRYAIGKNVADANTVKRPHFAIFLGAGASRDSHIKLAWEMMEDFKKIILADEGLTFDTDKEKDDWFEAQDWFRQSDNKYSCLFCRAYKTDIDRRNYIQDVIAEGEASLGYIILSNFIAEGYVETIITTNFDDLVYQACTSYTAVRPVVYSLGGFASEMSSMIDRPKVIKIHGDFLFSRLKNTEDQLREQDPNMSDQVEEILRKYEGLIVIGYRGSDDSVMRLLQKLPDGHSLYWCEVSRLIDGKPTIELNQNVVELLKAKNGKLVEITGFDRLMKEMLEIVDFDENIIVKAFEKRQDKLNEELHKFDIISPDGDNQPPGETEKKEETFSAKIENVFDNISLRNKAVEAWKAKKYDEQEKIARQMIKNNPDDFSGYFQLALAQRSIGKDLHEAEENYRKAIKLNPNFWEAYNNLGVLLAKDETRQKEAKENYRKAIELNPNLAEAYNNLGALLAKDKNRQQEVEENYRKAIKLNPNYADAYNNLGILLAKDVTRREEAEENYRKAIKLNPNYAEAYNNLGNLLAKDETRREEAEESYRKAIKLNPNYAEAYNNLGVLLAKDVTRREEAEENYRKAIKLNPNYADAYNNLGILLAKDETRREEAEESYRKAIKLNPNYENARNNLGILLAKDETRREEAEENYRKVIELNPNLAAAYFNLACLYSIRKNRNEALNYLKKAAEMDSKFKSIAKTDSDFDSIRDDEKFREIVGGEEE